MNAPLAGTRVLELSRTSAGSLCGMLLSDLGADVIALSDLGAGAEAAPETSARSGLDRGKRSVGIRLDQPEGRGLVRELLLRCDLFVTSWSAQELAEAGIEEPGPGSRVAGLVTCRVSPFGPAGELAGRPATDLTLQAWSGVLSLTGHAGLPPVPNAFPIADLAGGLYGACASVAALVGAHERGARGCGDGSTRIEVSQLHALVQLLGYTAQQYLLTGQIPGRVGSGHHSISPYECYRAADGWIVVCAFTQGIWLRLLEALQAPELAADPRFSDLRLRSDHRAELTAEINRRLSARPIEHWLPVLLRYDVAAAKVVTLTEALRSPFVAERELVVEQKANGGGSVFVIASPIIGDGQRWTATGPIPARGEHTASVLTAPSENG